MIGCAVLCCPGEHRVGRAPGQSVTDAPGRTLLTLQFGGRRVAGSHRLFPSAVLRQRRRVGSGAASRLGVFTRVNT